MDNETQRTLLRLAIILNCVFGVFAYNSVSYYTWVKRIASKIGFLRRFINIGLVVVSDERGTSGNFSLSTLTMLTAGMCGCFLFAPEWFFAVYRAPWLLVHVAGGLWYQLLVASAWLLPVALLVCGLLVSIGVYMTFFLWLFSGAVLIKTFACIAEGIAQRLTKRQFDFFAYGLLLASGIITLILV